MDSFCLLSCLLSCCPVWKTVTTALTKPKKPVDTMKHHQKSPHCCSTSSAPERSCGRRHRKSQIKAQYPCVAVTAASFMALEWRGYLSWDTAATGKQLTFSEDLLWPCGRMFDGVNYEPRCFIHEMAEFLCKRSEAKMVEVIISRLYKASLRQIKNDLIRNLIWLLFKRWSHSTTFYYMLMISDLRGLTLCQKCVNF